MNATSATFSRSVYRDLALFALAAIGVGIAVSLVLATLIVLTAPEPAHAALRTVGTSIQQPAAS